MSLATFLNFLNRLFDLVAIATRLLWKTSIRHDGKEVHLNGPRRVRLFFEMAGGAFLKLGQILALRTDMFPEHYTDELLGLLSHVPETPFPQMEHVFYEDYGVLPRDYFAEFTVAPLASASVGQVYKAQLRTGEHVAVKIQRPNISEQFENDFIVARFLADLFGVFHIARAIDWHEVVDEFVTWTRRELDFTVEAKNAETIARFSSKRPQTHIPVYYVLLSTKRVLICEFMHGLLSAEHVIDVCAKDKHYRERLLREQQIDLHEVAHYFVVDMIRQFFIDGFFHADPHPANIYFLRGNRLGYLDFGIIGEVGRDRVHMLRMLQAISERDMYAVAKSFFTFSRFAFEEDIRIVERFEEAAAKERYVKTLEKIEEIMVDNLVAALRDIFDPWYAAMDEQAQSGKSNKRESASRVFARLVATARDYSIYFPREVALFFRTLSIIDMVALRLTPRFDMLRAFALFFTEFPLATAEGLITAGTYEEKMKETIESLQNLSYEEMMELKTMDQERLVLARERLADLMGHYAERYDEVRVLLKG